MTSSLKRIVVLAVVAALASLGLLAPSATAAGNPFYVKKNHTITITLPTAADGGYGWVVVKGKNSTKFKVISKKVIYKKTANGVVGGPAKTVYKLRTTAYGTAVFKAVERRSFDKADVIDEYTVTLHVTRTGKKPKA